LAPLAFATIVEFFPHNTTHACLFLDSLSQLLRLVEPIELGDAMLSVFQLFGRCIASPHYQVIHCCVFALARSLNPFVLVG
jgi:hypothetical protein